MNRFNLNDGKTQIEVSKNKDFYEISIIEVLGVEFNKKLGFDTVKQGCRADLVIRSKESLQELIIHIQNIIDVDAGDHFTCAFRIK